MSKSGDVGGGLILVYSGGSRVCEVYLGSFAHEGWKYLAPFAKSSHTERPYDQMSHLWRFSGSMLNVS
jgi:hypothetical protein